ncbi:MAG: HTH domain-containing protein [Haloferacaceae archaeon]
MEQVDLTDSQRRLLATLVDEYGSAEAPVKGAVLAEALDRSPATIRSQVQSLTALGLVEGIQGPKGGYKPTAAGYDVLDRQGLDDPESVTLAREFDRADATVDEIDLPDLNHPDRCTARVHFQEVDRQFEPGDPVAVGPTPVAGLLLAGRVTEVNEAGDEVVLEVAELTVSARAE